MPTDPEPRLVFRGAAWKSGLRTLGSLAGVLACVFMLESDYETQRYSKEMGDIISIGCIAMFGCNAGFSFLRLCSPPELILTHEGFSVRGLRKAQLIPWGDVQGFDLVKQRGGTTVAGYVLKPGVRSGARDRSLTRFLMPGFDGTIAVSPEESPGYVVKILNDWRRRYAPPS
ncbi:MULTISPECIES: hypothetical protein [unclassified Brevundimonas]|uniref:hypothetical protein n=1 Tax=unclassified Brevundimonas TaxID=2622653 RepID=UPI0025BFE36D|nr:MULTISPECIES: hypothetical protein [unclassified Brevundimonas]